MSAPALQTDINADRLMLGVLYVLGIMSLALAPLADTWGPAWVVTLIATLVPTALVYLLPGSLLTRLTIAAMLMVYCALHIHQASGMIEMHFGIFVLLAFLLCYRDWRPIAFGAVVVAVHHALFNYLQERNFGVLCFTHTGWGIVVVHAAYVVAETAVLSYLAHLLRREGLQATELQRMVSSVAAGDKIDLARGHGSLQSQAGQALAQVVGRLRETIGSIARGTGTVTSAAQETSRGGAELERRSAHLSTVLADMSTTIEQLTKTTQDNADQARHANSLVDSAAEVAARGGRVVANVVSTMGEISQSSQKISDIIGVIDEIAFQTNLLALNAAVEAARAGEQGRGFAVVASEVRNLAMRSATAAREIKTLIQASVESVQVGSKLVDDAGTTMNAVVGSVRQITQVVGALQIAFADQSRGMAQVKNSVTQLDDANRHNNGLVAAMTRAAAQLHEHGQALSGAVQHFRLDEERAARAA
jgi:methyl-accepting chemotaxis protein